MAARPEPMSDAPIHRLLDGRHHDGPRSRAPRRKSKSCPVNQRGKAVHAIPNPLDSSSSLVKVLIYLALASETVDGGALGRPTPEWKGLIASVGSSRDRS